MEKLQQADQPAARAAGAHAAAEQHSPHTCFLLFRPEAFYDATSQCLPTVTRHLDFVSVKGCHLSVRVMFRWVVLAPTPVIFIFSL